MNKKIKRYPKGKFGEIKEIILTKANALKIRDNLANYIEGLETAILEKNTLTPEEIKEIENLNRVLKNKEKYEADKKISLKAIETNKQKLGDLNEIIKILEENNLEEYNPKDHIDLDGVEEIK